MSNGVKCARELINAVLCEEDVSVCNTCGGEFWKEQEGFPVTWLFQQMSCDTELPKLC